MVDVGQPPEKSESVSMEEILNSIRQAIGETNNGQNGTSLNQSEFAPVGSDILELTHPIEISAPAPSVVFPPPPPPPAPSLNMIPISEKSVGETMRPSSQPTTPILSEDSYESVAHAFKVLSKAVEVKQAQVEHTGLSGQTVDVLMKEIMRPFIRDWLNQNLPTIVERLVAKEIERLTQSTLS